MLRSDIRIIDAREGRFSIRRIYFYGREAPPCPSELPASSFRISHTVIPIPNTVIPRRNECDDEESLHTKDLCAGVGRVRAFRFPRFLTSFGMTQYCHPAPSFRGGTTRNLCIQKTCICFLPPFLCRYKLFLLFLLSPTNLYVKYIKYI